MDRGLRRRLIAPAALSLTLVLAGVASAGPATDTLRAFFDEASRIVTAPDPGRGLEERRNAVRALAERIFDFRGAAAVALGPAWQGRTRAEREEFTRLFTDLVESGYLTLLGSKARVRDGVSVQFLGERVLGDAATVHTSLLTRSGDDMPVDYRMRRQGDRWTVRDVVIDGVSLVENYHAQFHRVLQGSSYADLVSALRERAPEVPRALAAADAPVSSVSDAPRSGPVTPSPVTPPPGSVRAGPASPPILFAERPVPAAIETPAAVVPAPSWAAAGPGAEEPRARRAASEGLQTKRPVQRPAPRSVAPTKVPHAWWVQVGAFRNAEAASRLLERLDRELAVAVFDGTADAPIARVLVGPFAERARATAKLRELQASGYPAFITAGR